MGENISIISIKQFPSRPYFHKTVLNSYQTSHVPPQTNRKKYLQGKHKCKHRKQQLDILKEHVLSWWDHQNGMRKSRQEIAKNNVSKLRKLLPFFISQKLLLMVLKMKVTNNKIWNICSIGTQSTVKVFTYSRFCIKYYFIREMWTWFSRWYKTLFF